MRDDIDILVSALPRAESDASAPAGPVALAQPALRGLRRIVGNDDVAAVALRSIGVSEMEWQVARLAAALGQRDSWVGLVDEFPCVVEAQQALARQLDLPAAVVAEQLAGLYRRHCEEWSRFPAANPARVRKEAA